MENITPQQRRKLEKLLKLGQEGLPALLEYIFEIEEKLDVEMPAIMEVINRITAETDDNALLSKIEEAVKRLTPEPEEIDYDKIAKLVTVKDGKDYILTEKDKKEIASKITVPKPQPDKIIEKTETIIKEQPIEIIKEVAVITDEEITSRGEAIRDGLELLQDEERLDKKAIKGLDDYDEVSRLARTQRQGGGGKQNLYQLNDVNIQAPVAGQVLVYNDENGLWENEYPEITTNLTFMFTNVASDISTYLVAKDLPNYVIGAIQTITTVGVSTTPTLLATFATQTGYPNKTVIPVGIFHFHFETEKVAGANNYYCYTELYKRTTGGTETLLATSDITTQTAINTVVQQTMTAINTTADVIDATDRIVVKVYAVMLSSTATIKLYIDDNTDARFEMPSTSLAVPDLQEVTDVSSVTTNSIEAQSLITTGGTSSQFVKGDGSLDSSKTIQLSGDLRGWYYSNPNVILLDMDSLVLGYPSGITITNWKVYCNTSPTTQLAGTISYCDAVTSASFPGASPTVIDTIATTAGYQTRTDMSLSTLGSGSVPATKILYLALTADPTDYNKKWTLIINFTIN